MYELNLTHARWQKSSYSGGNGNCVEVATLSQVVAVRDSKDAVGPKLIFTRADWQGFVSAVAEGHADI